MTFASVSETDFAELADIRVAAMRESLERVGRFDLQKARQRLRDSFLPSSTWFILLGGKRAGFYTARQAPEGIFLDHFYILPEFQNRGVGTIVMKRVIEKAAHCESSLLVGALKGSPSNRFYQRHGFVKTSEGDWDNYYTREPAVKR